VCHVTLRCFSSCIESSFLSDATPPFYSPPFPPATSPSVCPKHISR